MSFDMTSPQHLQELHQVACLCYWMRHMMLLLTLTVELRLISLDVAGVI